LVAAASHTLASGAVHLPAATFWAGSDRHYPEEAPRHLRSVDGFWIATKPVTNSDFAGFVAATGYVTEAEKNHDAMIFTAVDNSVGLRSITDCWSVMPAANWRRPDGSVGLNPSHDGHPVVQVTLADALAYAEWADARLPSEAEWEYAASYEQQRQEFIWGDTLLPEGERAANIWARGFPFARELGLAPWGTSPTGQFGANPAGLFDMIGNVWEWTSDPYSTSHRGQSSCCGASDGPDLRVIKGGSHLCSPAYCQRYRPAARHAQDTMTPTSHIGFRLVWSERGDV